MDKRFTNVLIFLGVVLVFSLFHSPAAAQTPRAVKLGATQYFTLPNSGAWTEGSGGTSAAFAHNGARKTATATQDMVVRRQRTPL